MFMCSRVLQHTRFSFSFLCFVVEDFTAPGSLEGVDTLMPLLMSMKSQIGNFTKDSQSVLGHTDMEKYSLWYMMTMSL